MRESHISPRLRERSLEGRRSNQNQLQPINTNTLNKIIQIKNSILHNILKCKPGAEAKFFKTSIIVWRNRSHTFSFKSWPPYEKNLASPPIRSHKNAPLQIPTFHLFDFSFPSLTHVSYIPHFFFLEWGHIP